MYANTSFGIYESRSIRDVKLKDLGDIEIGRKFCTGTHQKTPINFNGLLKISSFESIFR